MSSTVLDEPKINLGRTRSKLETVLPTRTKLSSRETVAGNRYDLVLAGPADIGDNYHLYDSITELVEREKNLRIYSPHNDFRRGHNLRNCVSFTVNSAIPRTRGVILDLTTVTDHVQEMFDATLAKSKPFLVIYSESHIPFGDNTLTELSYNANFCGELVYDEQEEVIDWLKYKIDDLIRGK
jgi:hypothetical protein